MSLIQTPWILYSIKMQINSISWIIHQQRVKLKFKYNSLTHNIPTYTHTHIYSTFWWRRMLKEACKDDESTTRPTTANTLYEEEGSAAGLQELTHRLVHSSLFNYSINLFHICMFRMIFCDMVLLMRKYLLFRCMVWNEDAFRGVSIVLLVCV